MSSSAKVNPSVDGTTTTAGGAAGAKTKLPIREIPGSYGVPFFGAIKDRLDFYYNQGNFGYFSSRVKKYNSTVVRLNTPPGPFMAADSRVVALLDAKSFPVLFDVSKVEKRDVFTGTYMPSTSLTGGYRALSYLDPSEPKHALLKQLLFHLIHSRSQHFLPTFRLSFSSLFDSLESQLASSPLATADFNSLNDSASFDFLSRAYFGVVPTSTELGSQGPSLASKWVFFSLHPIIALHKLPKLLEDLLLHTFPLPPFLVSSDYRRLYDFFSSSASSLLDEAEKMGLKRDEACHNVLFATCFNTFGGMKVFFPVVMKYLALAGEAVHRRLAEEIRSAVATSKGEVTLAAIENMPLTKSAVYEALRIEPPVMYQYGRAKEDLVVETHDAAFEVKKGEMLFGFQPLATRDPRVFEDADKYVADRFVGEGAKLLRYVFWSNGPETESPTVADKQCAGKDFVILIGRLLVVEFFLRYDTFTAESSTLLLGPSVSITSLKKAGGK